MPKLKYLTDSGAVFQIRISTAKAAFAGAEPAGAIDDLRFNVTAQGSKRKKNSLIARNVVYTRSDAVGTTGRVSVQSVTIPILDPANLATAPATINYQGKSDWKISTSNSEG